MLGSLVEHVAPALEEAGELALVHDLLSAVLDRGTGAARQRAILDCTGDLKAVVADAVDAVR